jgi:hypothetical protein
MRERESRIGSAVAVRLQAGCKRNPTIASVAAQVVELEGEGTAVEPDVWQHAGLSLLTDPARRAAKTSGSFLEVEQVPGLSGRRQWKLSGQLEREPRHQLVGKRSDELLGQVRGEHRHRADHLARAAFSSKALTGSRAIARPLTQSVPVLDVAALSPLQGGERVSEDDALLEGAAR